MSEVQETGWSQVRKEVEQDIKQQHFKKAIGLLEGALKVAVSDQELGEIFLLYSKVALKTGEYEAADFYLAKLADLPLFNNSEEFKAKSALIRIGLQLRTEKVEEVKKLIRKHQGQNEFPEDLAYNLGLKNLLSICLMKEGQYDSALLFINMTMRGYELLGTMENLSNAMQDRAYCLIELNRNDSIISLLSTSIGIARQKDNLELQMEGLFLLGKYYQKFGPIEAALIHLEAASSLVSQGDSINLESSYFIANSYYEYFASTRDYEKAMEWFIKATELERKLKREDLALKAAFSDSIKTIGKQQSRLLRNQTILGLLGLGLVVIAIILLMQRRLLRLKSKMAQQLKHQNDELLIQGERLEAQKALIEKRSEKLESFLVMLETLGNSSKINQGKSQKALEEICQIIHTSLDVSRVGIWDYNKTDRLISRRLLLENGNLTSESAIILASDYPKYFEAISQKKLIVADNARNDPSTQEFKGSYLDVHGITSMIDTPILINGELAGIICCEHVGEQRTWETEDTLFLLAISDFISITLLTEKIKLQNESLIDSNLSLEDAVNMRTMELELQNKQLAEYAFVNSHLLRSPLAKILGLAEIMKIEFSDENTQIVDAMIQSAEELDQIVKRIATMLYDGKHFSRDEINDLKKNLL